MLDPQRAVLIEGGDALLGRHKRRLAWSVVPRTKSTMAFFATPSFHEGGGSWAFAGVAHNRQVLLQNQGVPAAFIRSGGSASLRRRGAKCSVRTGPRMEVVTISTRTTLSSRLSSRR
jgi:hypothetical protein